MCRGVSIFFFAVVLGYFSIQPAFADFVRIAAEAKPAVVQLEVRTSDGFKSGTGFFISPEGYLVTNAHVIAGALTKGDVVATGNEGTRYLVERLAYMDRDADIAILKFDCSNVKYLLPVEDGVAEGQTILVIGSPERLVGTVSNGIVAAIREDQNRIQITAAVSPGSSGSPVLNEYGTVIAVVSEILEEGQNLNFAIPAKEVWKGMFAISGIDPHPVAKNQGQADQVLNDAIKKLVSKYPDPEDKEFLRDEEFRVLKQRRERSQNDPRILLKETIDEIYHIQRELTLTQMYNP
jgi:hypothetical protein